MARRPTETRLKPLARRLALAGLACLASACCFFYPGGGKCDPMEYDGSCVDETTTRNCQDVTPFGYGIGVIKRYAILDDTCRDGNVCTTTRWGTAICVAKGAEKCPDIDETRCVDGRKQVCHWDAVMSPREPREYEYFWAETGENCHAVDTDTGQETTTDMGRTDAGADAGERDVGSDG